LVPTTSLMHHVLFVCSQNRFRSPTAELLKWANSIFVMERSHRNKLLKKFRPYLKDQRIICLNIPDEYEYMDPILIRLLQSTVPRYLQK
jgi:predicted protein tyrosine phosphatase